MRTVIRGFGVLALALGFLGSSTAATASDRVAYEPVGVSEVFVPVGFDDNDEIMVVLDGYLPNSCYRLSAADVEVDVNSSTIYIEQIARVFEGPCIMALVPYATEVKLGVLPEGNYTISLNGGALREPLPVSEATSAGPDDHLYAPIDNVYVEREPDGDRLFAVIEGRFTNSCMSMPQENIELQDNGKSLNLLPIMKFEGQGCREETTTFKRVIPLPTSEFGRYLLHVRSLNGQALNKVFSLPHHGIPM